MVKLFRDDWCNKCKFVSFYDWYICMNENVDTSNFDQEFWIPSEDFWKTCKCYTERKENE